MNDFINIHFDVVLKRALTSKSIRKIMFGGFVHNIQERVA